MATRILKEDVAHDRVAQVLQQMGLVLGPPVEEAPEGMLWQNWTTPDKESRVEYVDDSVTKVHSITTEGKKEGELEKKLEKELPLWELDDLLKHALVVLKKGPDAARQRVCYEIGMEMDGNGYDPGSAGVLEAYLQWDEPGARLAGARGFRMLPQRRFRLTAEGLANDADPAVAEVGKDMLEQILELHGDTHIDEDNEEIIAAVARRVAKKAEEDKP
jgi:hypothetical protein